MTDVIDALTSAFSDKEKETERVRREFFGGALSVYDAGVFHDEKTNTDVLFDQGIKVSFGKVSMRVTAAWLAGLVQIVKQDEEVRAMLIARLEEEKKAISAVSI